MKKVFLAVLDGYGTARNLYDSAITPESSPEIFRMQREYASSKVKTSGLAAGLPEGQMGNSEVGHLNIGAGRIVYQDLTKISKAVKDGDFFANEAFIQAAEHTKQRSSKLHIMGLVSDGGVHSSDIHYKALIEAARRNGAENVFIHCFTDGRDTPPKSAINYVRQLEEYINELGYGKIVSVCGRYYAMDRDSRFERTRTAYEALAEGRAEISSSASEYIQKSYAEGITDEFLKPCLIADGVSDICTIDSGDAVIFFNFRPDRARQLSGALMEEDFSGFERVRKDDLFFVSMTQYDETFSFAAAAYPPKEIENTLGEYLSSLGMKQLRIAETEKYAHVTYFFNGGNETAYAGEDRILIPSPKVATYDLKPEMSAPETAEELQRQLMRSYYDLIVVNFANCDMVGHTGVMQAALKAVKTVDSLVGMLVETASENGYACIITADHGNAEQMLLDGEVFTAHTTNDVPFIVIDDRIKEAKDGSLCDIAPTVLEIMGIEKPPQMTGGPLVTIRTDIQQD